MSPDGTDHLHRLAERSQGPPTRVEPVDLLTLGQVWCPIQNEWIHFNVEDNDKQ